MRTFDYIKALDQLKTHKIEESLANLAEYKGKLGVYRACDTPILRPLYKSAEMQSVIASNAIENIVTTKARVSKLLHENVVPKTRDEREIAGYSFVLDEINDSYKNMPVTPNVILQLHRDLYRFSNVSHAGRWKDTDNVIGERTQQGSYKIRFQPASALETPDAIDALCSQYAKAIEHNQAHTVLAILLFVFDFLAVHPFLDGNGRLSRLLTTLLLYQQGHFVSRYMSLEEEINKTRDTYYSVLALSSSGWREGENDPLPFVLYMLEILEKCYRKLDKSIVTSNAGNTNEDIIRLYFSQLQGAASKEEILRDNPKISKRTLERILKVLQDEGSVHKIGAARSTLYISTQKSLD